MGLLQKDGGQKHGRGNFLTEGREGRKEEWEAGGDPELNWNHRDG
jgi:hypothetical protein